MVPRRMIGDFAFKQWLSVHIRVITTNVTKDKHDKNHNNNTPVNISTSAHQTQCAPCMEYQYLYQHFTKLLPLQRLTLLPPHLASYLPIFITVGQPCPVSADDGDWLSLFLYHSAQWH